MSSLEVWLIIILVLGVIASNLAVLKYSSKFKMTQFGKPHHKPDAKTARGEADQDAGKDNKTPIGNRTPEGDTPIGDKQTSKTDDAAKDQD
ncbi:DUF2897 family protein [Shewanella sp. cp20]|uniref:DUF2897 family protein n=1 Tax=Shewanella sp. cp20 TaxID=1521167 RepID=UPI0005A2F859|nr:DUF2897 family protein [Shewanella sp. cp20]KIO35429.1 hypothetical protein DB48_17145 [Shewanella sp. cp20]